MHDDTLPFSAPPRPTEPTALDSLIDRVTAVTESIEALESSAVDTKLGRGLLWLEVDTDVAAEIASELSIGLQTMRHERWLAGRFPAGSPAAWLSWHTLRDIAPLDDDTIEAIIQAAIDMGERTSEAVSRLAREEKARRKAGGVDPAHVPDADPVQAETRAAFFAARAVADLGADFEPPTCERIAAWAERCASEWERASSAAMDALFGAGPGGGE